MAFGTERRVPELFLTSMCLIAISNDFFEMVLPNTLFSEAVVEDLADLLAATSEASAALAWPRLFAVYSDSLPLLAIGDGCLLDMLTGACISEFGFEGRVTTAPGRDLPAETGLSAGNVVLRFGGVSRGKSGGTTGWRRGVAGLRPTRVTEGDGDGSEWRRVGVEGRKVAGMDGFEVELGVDGLEPCDVLVLLMSIDDELVGLGIERGSSTLGGVGVDVDVDVVREVGVEGLAADGERVMGEDGLVLRMEEDLFGLRVTEPLLDGLE